MTQILVATDLSDRSDRAVRRAFCIAAEQGIGLTALTVLDADMPAAMAAAQAAEAERHLSQFCREVAGSSDVAWTARVMTGDPSLDIGYVAGEIDAPLVVTGRHRRRMFFDHIRETTIERVLRGISRPVLLVVEAADRPYERVLAPIDLSPASAAALAAAQWLAPGAELRIFHAVHAGFAGMSRGEATNTLTQAYLRDARAAVGKWCETHGWAGKDSEPRVVEGALTAVFDRERSAFAPDLIAIGAHSRHGLGHRALGSFASGLVRDPPADLLIARD